jgi:hypothetical protein
MNALSAHTGILRPPAAAVEVPRFPKWGPAEFFVIAQTALPALLFLPGTQPVRLYLRVASFVLSAVILAVWATQSRPSRHRHPAEPWLIAATLYVAVMMLHPLTSSLMAGAAHFALYLTVIAPLFWAGSYVRNADHLARLLGVLLVCNGVNATVGVLQVHDPATWMPQEMSRIVTESPFGLGAVTYMGPNGLIVRPPGLFDNPGAVAGPGMYATLLGLVFAIGVAPLWKRLLSLAAAFAGLAAIYLSQVRVSLVVCLVMLVSYVVVMSAQNRARRAIMFGALATGLVVSAFAFSLMLGGGSIAERTSTLLTQDPISLYSASRGGQLVYTFEELLATYPIGAGLGRWGMIGGYFGGSGNPESTRLWAEIQIAGWAIDGGIPLLFLSLAALAVTFTSQVRIAYGHTNAKVRACAAVILAANVGTVALMLSFTPFVTQIGVQFWFLAGALHSIGARGHGAFPSEPVSSVPSVDQHGSLAPHRR